MTDTKSEFLKAKATNEVQWIQKVNETARGQYAVIPWEPSEVKGENLLELLLHGCGVFRQDSYNTY